MLAYQVQSHKQKTFCNCPGSIINTDAGYGCYFVSEYTLGECNG
jgi:hypothetical protein